MATAAQIDIDKTKLVERDNPLSRRVSYHAFVFVFVFHLYLYLERENPLPRGLNNVNGMVDLDMD